MTARERRGNRNLAAARIAVARRFRLLAEREATEDQPFAHNSAASNAVLAAIGAADAICCLNLGRYHAGEDHRSAARLLEQVHPDGRELAKHLRNVLAVKAQVNYSGDPLPDSSMRRVLRSTARLLEAAERLTADQDAR